MKKHFATILVLCGMSAFVSAQGVFVIDSGLNTGDGSGPFATTGGLVWLVPDYNFSKAFLDTTQDINLSVLWGTSAANVNTALNIDPFNLNTGVYAGTGNWYASQPTGMDDITGYGNGALLDLNGNSYVVPGAAAGTTIFLVLQGWTGSATTYYGIHNSADFVGETSPFSVTLAVNTSPIQPDVHGMGAFDLISDPEPSIPAISALATLVFALFRRRK